MADPNDTDLLCWAYEATIGTATITAADSTSYLFGDFADDYQFTPPTLSKRVESAWKYSQRQPKQNAFAKPVFNQFKIKCFPNLPIPEYFFFGDGTDADPDTMQELSTGAKKSLNIRWEHKGGTTPARVNACGCFCTGLLVTAEVARPSPVEMTFDWWKYEDEGDRVALTTAPTRINSKTSQYQLSEVLYDYGGGGEAAKTYVTRVDIQLAQEVSAKSNDGTSQKVYPGKMQAPVVVVHGMFEDNAVRDDLRDENVKDLAVKLAKIEDATKYKQYVLDDVYWSEWIPTGLRHAGFYHAVAKGVAEKCTLNFTDESGAFGTFYP